MLMLDQPTNHLDVEAITRLANHLKSRWSKNAGGLMVVTRPLVPRQKSVPTPGKCTTASSAPSRAATRRTSLQRVERDRQGSRSGGKASRT